MKKKITLAFMLLASFSAESGILIKESVIKAVEKNFPNILLQQEKIIQAREETHAFRGVFDPSINGKFNSVPVGGYQNNYYEASLNYPIENTGNSIHAGYRVGRGDWPVYYQNYLTNSSGDTYVGLNVPLIRDRLIDKARQNILNNDLLTQSEIFLLTIKKNESIALAINVYYDWIRATKHLEIANELLLIAKTRQKAIDMQSGLGDIAKINQIENQRLIMQRRSVLVLEKQKYAKVKNKLQFYVGENSRLGKKIGNDEYSPPALSKRLPKALSQTLTLGSVTQVQPYLHFLSTKIKQSNLAIAQAKNEMKPGIDLDLFIDKQHGSGSSKLSETSVNIGLTYKFPLRLRKAEGQLAKSQSLIRSYQIQKKLFMRKLSLAYKNIVIDTNTFINLYQLRSREVKFAKQLETAERINFKAGGSSLFLVNQREQTVASTQFLEIDNLVSYYQKVNLLESLCFYKKQCHSFVR